jgi:hypothetical protein
LTRFSYASSSRWAISLRDRKNLPVDSSISSWAGAPAILDDIASAFEFFSCFKAAAALGRANRRVVRENENPARL